VKAEIEAALAQKSAAEWSALFNVHGVPAGEVLDVPSVLAHPQVASRALVKTSMRRQASNGRSRSCVPVFA
jgi:crotonobetainyl-CoA:carnitine CoA-transferase CaiB-like acyl-CoA transferase